MIKLYENIKNLRTLNGWTQEELAKRMGYTDRSMIAKIETGKIDLSQSKIIEFANVFGVAPGDLMGWDDTIDYEYKWYELGGGQHPLKLSPEEYSLILSFRKSDNTTKDMVNRILKYKELLEKRLNNANR